MLIRDFEHRQGHHARGVWLRLRRLLAFTRDAYAVSREDADRLIAEGSQLGASSSP